MTGDELRAWQRRCGLITDTQAAAAAIDVWWRYPTPAEPQPLPSRFAFHELPNVLMTPMRRISGSLSRLG